MVTAGATANTTKGNSRESRESGLLCAHSHGESIDGQWSRGDVSNTVTLGLKHWGFTFLVALHPWKDKYGGGWPLKYLLLLLVVCARINPSFILSARLHCPHCRNTIARLLRNVHPPPLDIPFVCHTPYNISNNNIVQRRRRRQWLPQLPCVNQPT